jgi:hypothetical protein
MAIVVLDIGRTRLAELACCGQLPAKLLREIWGAEEVGYCNWATLDTSAPEPCPFRRPWSFTASGQQGKVSLVSLAYCSDLADLDLFNLRFIP